MSCNDVNYNDLREKFITFVKYSKQTKRYVDMFKHIIELVKLVGGDLTNEEVNLLTIAFKSFVNLKREPCRKLKSIQQYYTNNNDDNSNTKNIEATISYIKIIENEIDEHCKMVLKLIDDYLLESLYNKMKRSNEIKDCKADELELIYKTLKADHYRYLAEIYTGEDREKAINDASQAYNIANELANKSNKFKPTNPLRAGFALNYSVFYYEILASKEEACNIARDAYEKAKELTSDVDETVHKDLTEIMKALEYNLNSWSNET